MDLTDTEELSLNGSFSHNHQLSDAPLMMTLPISMEYNADGLVLLYNIVCNDHHHIRKTGYRGNNYAWRKALYLKTGTNEMTSQRTYTYKEISNLKDSYSKIAGYSVAVFVKSNARLVLLKHRKLGIWLPPGGRVEQGESLDRAAIREVFEETGLAIRLLNGRYPVLFNGHPATIPVGLQIETRPDGSNYIDFVYISEPIGGDRLVKNLESLELGWYKLDEISSLTLTAEMRLWCNKLLRQTAVTKL
jgi:8-oxo-dGTP pyrophosphatase MutT (NUDIX family)